MVTGTIKNKVDKIWTDIWAGGITNPLTVIEQLTYLMFIRSLDEKECQTANCGRRFLYFDFGVFASPIALSFLSRRIPGGVAA